MEHSSPGMPAVGRAQPLSTRPSGGTGSPMVWNKEDEVGPRRRPGVQLPVLLPVGGGPAGSPAPTLHCQRVAEVTSSLLQNLPAYWDTDHPPPAPTPIMGPQHQSLGPGLVQSTPGRTQEALGGGQPQQSQTTWAPATGHTHGDPGHQPRDGAATPGATTGAGTCLRIGPGQKSRWWVSGLPPRVSERPEARRARPAIRRNCTLGCRTDPRSR